MIKTSFLQNLEEDLYHYSFEGKSLLLSFNREKKCAASWVKKDLYHKRMWVQDASCSIDPFLSYPFIISQTYPIEIFFDKGYHARMFFMERVGGYKEPFEEKEYAYGFGFTLPKALESLDENLKKKREFDSFCNQLDNQILEVSIVLNQLKGFWLTSSDEGVIWNGNYLGSLTLFHEYENLLSCGKDGYEFQFSLFHGIYRVQIIKDFVVLTSFSGTDFKDILEQADHYLGVQDLTLHKSFKEVSYVN